MEPLKRRFSGGVELPVGEDGQWVSDHDAEWIRDELNRLYPVTNCYSCIHGERSGMFCTNPGAEVHSWIRETHLGPPGDEGPCPTAARGCPGWRKG